MHGPRTAARRRPLMPQCCPAFLLQPGIPYDEERFEKGRGKRTARHNQKLHPGKHEPIVSEELWRLAQVVKRSNTPVPRDHVSPSSGNRKYALSGLLVCPTCGSKMRSKPAGRDKPWAWYECSRRRYHGDKVDAGGCPFPRLSTIKVHQAFWAKLSELLGSPNLVARVHECAHELVRRSASAQAEQDALGKEAGELRRQLETWSRRHADAEPDSQEESDAAAQIRKLKGELKRLKSQATTRAPAATSLPAISTEKVAAYLKPRGARQQDERPGQGVGSVTHRAPRAPRRDEGPSDIAVVTARQTTRRRCRDSRGVLGCAGG